MRKRYPTSRLHITVFADVYGHYRDEIQNLRVLITNQFDAKTARICMRLMEQFAAVARRDAALFQAVRDNTAALRELQLSSGHVPPAPPDSRGYAFKELDGSKAAAAALLCAAMFTARPNGSKSDPTTFALLLVAFTILMCSMTWDACMMVSNVMYTRHNSITLHDAMGRKRVLPFELCATYEVSSKSSFNCTETACADEQPDLPHDPRQLVFSDKWSLVYRRAQVQDRV